MALLWLWTKFLEGRNEKSNGFKVFVVDHQARPESSEEALRVSEAVMRMTGSYHHIDLIA